MRFRITIGILCAIFALGLTPAVFATSTGTAMCDTAQGIYDDIVNAPGDPFGYNGDTSDGCWARSILICKAIQDSGKLPEGCYLDTVFVKWPPGAYPGWRYHQACTMTCYTENGVETFVMDGLEGEVLSEDDWNTEYECPGGTYERKFGSYWGYYCEPTTDEDVEAAEREVEARRGEDGDGKPSTDGTDQTDGKRVTRASRVATVNATSNGCAAAYATIPIFIDPATGWEYHYQTVVDIQFNGNGNMIIGLDRLQAWIEFPAGTPQAFIDAATTSYTDGTPIHVAIDNAGGVRTKTDFLLPQPLDQIQWVDPLFQHPSCN